MASDGMPDLRPAGDADSAPVTIARGAAARARRRKLAILSLLLVVLAVLGYTAFYLRANNRLPIPRVVPATEGIDAPQYLYSISGIGADALTRPVGVAVGSDGRVYVADYGSHSIKVFTPAGDYLFKFSAIKDGANTALRNPVHVALDAQDHVWVTDRRLQTVYVFDSEGAFLRKVTPDGAADYPWSPLALTIDVNGDLYVTDVASVDTHRVLVLDKAGKIVRTFGTGGHATSGKSDPGMFSYPNGIVVSGSPDGSREVFVADSNNRRVQVFSADGKFKRFIITQGTPRGLAIDASRHLFVVDVLSHQIDIFSTAGQKLASFGGNGFGIGQFQYPEDVAIDAQGRIYVSDRENNQVQVWGFRVADIPGVTKLAPGQAVWWLLLLPLLLVPLFVRRRRFVATPDFIEGMVTAELVGRLDYRRWRWIVAETDHEALAGRVVDGVDLGSLFEAEPYSHSDASALAERLGIPIARAGVLAMGKRARILCTEDPELSRLGVLLGMDVYDRKSFVERFIERRRDRR